LNTAAIVALGAIGLGSLAAAKTHMTSAVDNQDYPIEADVSRHFVSIIMPTLNEENAVEDALKSIHNQNIMQKNPDNFEVVLADSNSKDKTLEVAEPYVSRVISCPDGKLASRNHATRRVNGDIIVAVDADTYYPPNWLNFTLRHFNNDGVVAVSGPSIFDGNVSVLGRLSAAGVNLFGRAGNYISGRNSAFTKDGFENVGGFNTDAEYNQLTSRILSTWIEEEWAFGKRLSDIGKYVFDYQASVYTSARRFQYKPEYSTYYNLISSGQRM